MQFPCYRDVTELFASGERQFGSGALIGPVPREPNCLRSAPLGPSCPVLTLWRLPVNAAGGPHEHPFLGARLVVGLLLVALGDQLVGAVDDEVLGARRDR